MGNNYQQNNYGATNDQKGGDQRKKYTLEVNEAEFPGTLKTNLTTTNTLAKTIFGMFAGLNNDFEGCAIEPINGTGELKLTLYFHDKPLAPKMMKNIVNIYNNPQGSRLIDRVKNMNSRSMNRVYDLSEETKEMLEDFINAPRKNGKAANINWKDYIVERSERGNLNRVYVAVINLDINKVLRKMYGSTNEEGDRVDYRVSIVQPIQNNFSPMVQNYLISIVQLNNKSVDALTKELGLTMSQSSIPMYRG